MISFMDDHILTPETMLALVLLYIGSRNHADFATNHLLSPVLAPSSLLARFPKNLHCHWRARSDDR
ncbi:hormone-sensitive lipase [Aspergillus sp. HF37]|nr:hormone-sensitive lipase [Aspergillus sp. HF37]